MLLLACCAVIRRPLYKTLVHALRDVNPQAAALLEEAPKQGGGSSTKGYSRNATGRAMRSGSNVRALMSLGLLKQAGDCSMSFEASRRLHL